MNSSTFLRASASLAALVVSLPIMGAPAAAQTAGPAAVASPDMETVTVTARKRQESEKNVPIAITAISADTLQERHIDQVKDISALTPGLNIESDSVGRSLIDIRGVGTTLLDTVQPGIGIFVDGVYMPMTSYLNSPIVDVDHIEVLKGPQGTLFGNNTLGGAINVITRQPGDEVEGKINASYAGPDDYQSYSGSISGPIIPGELQARIGGAYQSDNGFIKNAIAGGYQNPLSQQALNGTLRWEPSDDATFTLNAYYNRVRGGQVNYYPVGGTTDYSDKADTNVRNLGTYRYAGANLKGVFDVASLNTTITAVGSYDTRTNNFFGDSDFGPIDIAVGGGSGSLHTVTGELRFDTKWNSNVSTLFGLFYDDQIFSLTGVTTLFPGTPIQIQSPSASRMDTENYAAYGTLFWQIDPTMEFTAGLRWDHQHVGATGYTAVPGNPAFAVPQVKSNELEPRVTLDKHWTPDLMTYASIARGFRGGGINPPNSPNPAYRGDYVWTYEVGMKSDFFDDTLSLDADAFYNDYYHFIGENSLAPATNGVGFVGINLNTGHVHAPGAELQAVWKATSNWTFTSGLSYIHSRIVDGSEYVQTTGMQLPYDRILLLPDWTYNIDSNYVVPMGSDDALVFDANAAFKSNTKGASLSAADSPTLKAYTIVNGTITWRHDAWDLSVYSTNLFNTKYFESYIDKSVLAAAGIPPTDVGILGDGRRVGVSATYRF
jgi:iron complex outermembrane receptor protein